MLNHSNLDIAITGMGVLSSHGLGVSRLTNALNNGLSLFRKSAAFPELDFPVIAAELNEFNFTNAMDAFSHLPKRIFQIGRRSPLTVQTSLIAALEAWEQADLFNRKIDLSRVGIIVAGQNTTQAYHYHLRASFQNQPSLLSPHYALHFMDTDQVGTLSDALGIQGEGFTVGGASASGNVAIIQAARLIQHEFMDICLVVGTLADLSPMEIQGFRNIGALGGMHFQNQPEKACRPFDIHHDGFILGQASGCLILESNTSAKKANAKILGKISGAAMKLDANRLANPNVLGEASVMEQALANAKLKPEAIQYINAHGSASPLGDETEIAAIKKIWGNAIDQVWINSSKSIIGHCIWAAGVIEAIATLIQMQEGLLHPNLNLEQPIDNDCLFVKEKALSLHIDAAISNSFGFGGINTCIVLTKEN